MKRHVQRAPRDHRRRSRRTVAARGLAPLLAIALLGCVKNPSGGASDGAEVPSADAHPSPAAEALDPAGPGTARISQTTLDGHHAPNVIALYTEKPELSAYVQSVGRKVAARSDHKRDYRFDILDSGDVDAFSDDGGRVYVTRGLLARISSEDEMAAALGREIAFLGGSKESAGSESEAVGLKYATDARYGPRGAADLLRTLAAVRTSEPARLELWLAGHPGSAPRLANLDVELQRIQETAGRASDRPLKRDPYLRMIDGIPVGWYSPGGYLKGARYVDIRQDVSIQVPDGWTVSPKDDALLLLYPADGSRAELTARVNLRPGVSGDAALDFTRKAAPREGYEVTKPPGHATLPTGEAAIVTMHGKDESGVATSVRKMFQVRFDRLYVLTYTVPVEREDETMDAFMKMTGSIKWLTPAEATPPPIPRITLDTVKDGESWKSIAEGRLGGDWRAARLAAWNGKDASEAPSAGMLVKIPPLAAFE